MVFSFLDRKNRIRKMEHLKNKPLDTSNVIPEGFEEYWPKLRKMIIICYLEKADRSLQREQFNFHSHISTKI